MLTTQTAITRSARLIVVGFAVLVAVGTSILTLPAMNQTGQPAPLLDAFFTSTSAVTVTGLVVVDTGQYWSGLGQGVILVLIQLGGFGLMTLGTLLLLAVAKSLSLRTRLVASVGTKTSSMADVRSVIRGVITITVIVEAIAAALLTLRFWVTYNATPVDALWQGTFHAVSAFNNAGFGLESASLIGYQTDPYMLTVIMVTVLLGSIGFPVVVELWRQWRSPSKWSVHTALTVRVTVFLVVVGAVLIGVSEWSNPGTFGSLGPGDKVTNSVFAAITPRTAGFNAIDYATVTDTTWLTTIGLMFVGGGSASCAGGIKVTTVAILVIAVLAEIRGRNEIVVRHRSISGQTVRQALSVAVLASLIAFCVTLVLELTTPWSLQDVGFETVSALSTVGLSTGITGDLPGPAQVLLCVVMFAGRLGPVVLATALALRARSQRFSVPESRPLIG